MPTVNEIQQTIPSEEKYQRIIQAGLTIFAHKGVHGTPVPPVAKAAGVGVGTLYRYFDNKEALVNAIFQDAKNRLQHYLLDGLDIRILSKNLFDDIWERLSRFALTEPDSFRFLELQDHYSYLDKTSIATENHLLITLGTLIKQSQKQGIINRELRPDIAIALFWGAFVGLFKAHKTRAMKLSSKDLSAARDACWQAIGGR